MQIRDRIKELRRVKAAELKPHPRNWRTHPKVQRDALRGVLAEVGYADALVARELPDASLQLIDGHLRAETTPEMEVPVLVVDLNDEETAKLLATLDPLGAMAEADRDVLAELVAEVETENESVRVLLEGMLGGPGSSGDGPAAEQLPPEKRIVDTYQVVVDCRDEDHQREVYERLSGEGLSCRPLTL